MQHVVEQRHRVGAGRRVGDLHREQRVPRGRRVVAVSVLRAAIPAVGHRLSADRPGRCRSDPQTRSRCAPAPSAADAAAQRARERRLAGVARVVASVGVEIADRARRVAAGSPSSSTAAAALPLRRRVGVRDREADRRRRRVAVAVRHREGRRRRPGPITGVSAVNEYVPSAFTLIEPAPMSIACE